MSDWLIGGLVVLGLIALFVFAWRAEPRSPGTRFRRRSMPSGTSLVATRGLLLSRVCGAPL